MAKKSKPAKITTDVLQRLQESMNDSIRAPRKEKKKDGKKTPSKKVNNQEKK